MFLPPFSLLARNLSGSLLPDFQQTLSAELRRHLAPPLARSHDPCSPGVQLDPTETCIIPHYRSPYHHDKRVTTAEQCVFTQSTSPVDLAFTICLYRSTTTKSARGAPESVPSCYGQS